MDKNATKEEIELAFKSWFQHNYGLPPSPPSLRSHIEWGYWVLQQATKASDE